MAQDEPSIFNNTQTTQGNNPLLVLLMPAMEAGTLAVQALPEQDGHLSVRPVFQFDPLVAREIILYVASKLSSPSFHQVSKIYYFADKLHLARFGRLLSGDRYIAMAYGPVPSNVYDMLKAAKTANSQAPGALSLDFSVHEGRLVVPHRQADLGWISDSERECLDEAIAQVGALSFGQLTEASHDLAWQHTEPNREMALEAIIASIGNPEGLLEHLQNPTP